MIVFNLKMKRLFQNLPILTETAPTRGEHMRHTDSQENSVREYADQVNAVFLEPGRQPEIQTQNLSEPTPVASTSKYKEEAEDSEEFIIK